MRSVFNTWKIINGKVLFKILIEPIHPICETLKRANIVLVTFHNKVLKGLLKGTFSFSLRPSRGGGTSPYEKPKRSVSSLRQNEGLRSHGESLAKDDKRTSCNDVDRFKFNR